MKEETFLIYSDENGDVKVNVMLINNDLWLTQELIAELFGKARNTINGHVKIIMFNSNVRRQRNEYAK